jgi:hypothetical protein
MVWYHTVPYHHTLQENADEWASGSSKLLTVTMVLLYIFELIAGPVVARVFTVPSSTASPKLV